MLRLFVCSIAIAILVAHTGCSKKEQAKTYPVSGKVTIDSAPLAYATIMLQPIEGGSFGYGETDSDGLFVISTFAVGDGAIPGEHRIIITKKNPAAELAPSDSASTDSDTQSNQELGSNNQVVPQRYGNAETSGLKVLVAEDLEPLELRISSIE